MRVNLVAQDKKKLIDILKNDTIMSAIMTSTYAQIDAWVDVELDSIAEVKKIIKRLLKINKYLIEHLIK